MLLIMEVNNSSCVLCLWQSVFTINVLNCQPCIQFIFSPGCESDMILSVMTILLFGLILTGSEKWALFWRFRAEALISHWNIYVFVSFDCSIPLFGLILTSSEKGALFWRFRAEILISCWDIYVFVSFDCSILLFGLILTGSEKWALFWRFRAEVLVSCWDIYLSLNLTWNLAWT